MAKDFFASSEVVELVKSEYDSPSQDSEEVRRLAHSIEGDFLDQYGRFVRPGMSPASDRIVVVDGQGMKYFLETYGKSSVLDQSLPQGLFTHRGRFIVFDNTANCWEHTADEYKTDAQIFYEGDDAEKARLLKLNFDTHNLGHEIAHYYQRQDLPWPARECGAYYYEKTVARKRLYPILGKHRLYAARLNFFAGLIEKYGDDAHKFSFGTRSLRTQRRDEIVSEFTFDNMLPLFPAIRRLASSPL